MVERVRFLATIVLLAAVVSLVPEAAQAQWGHVSVYSGVSVSPSPVTLEENFTVNFTLKETSGDYRTFESICVDIRRNDGSFLFTLATWNNVTINANATWTRSPTGQIYGNPAGTYKAVVRGRLAGGDWFDFSVTGSGVNPKSFTVVEPTGYGKVSSGVTVSPSPVVLEESFTTAFTLKEVDGWSITFQDVVVDIRTSGGSFVKRIATYSNVTLGPNATWTRSPSGTLEGVSAGTYKAVVRGRVSGGSWFDFTTTGSGVNPRSFAVVEPTGYASVSTGLTVTPDPVDLEETFSVSFTLKETAGWPITFEQVALVVLRSDNSNLFDMEMWNDVTIPAGGTWSRTDQASIYDNPAGTYKVILRGRVAGGDWFDFTTTGSGVNPRPFTVTQPTGYASVSSGVSVTPGTVELEEEFVVDFTLKETSGWPITFESVELWVLRSDDTDIFRMGTWSDISLSADGTWSASDTATVYGNPAGTYKAILRGRVAGGDLFDFTNRFFL